MKSELIFSDRSRSRLKFVDSSALFITYKRLFVHAQIHILRSTKSPNQWSHDAEQRTWQNLVSGGFGRQNLVYTLSKRT